MALIKPISGFPNSNTIDITNGTTFYTVIQGASSVVIAYICTIYDADTYDEIWTSRKVDLDDPLTAGDTLEIDIYPDTGMENNKSYFWILRMYQKTSDMFVTSSSIQKGSTNQKVFIRSQSGIKDQMEIKIGSNQRKIAKYKISDGSAVLEYPFPRAPKEGDRCEIYSNFVESISFPFKTRQTPVVTINFDEKTGRSRTGVFKGVFDETITVQIQWYKVIIYDSDLSIYHDSGKIFSSSMEYEYTNLVNHKTYYIQYIVQTLDDIFIESKMTELVVAYDTFALDTDISASANCDSTITLEWKEDRLADGVATGNYSFIYMGINTVLGMTIDGIALPQRYYSWIEFEDGVEIAWNDDYYWTESLLKTKPQKRLQVLSGRVYYNQANQEPLSINFNNFTILSDIFIPANTEGRIISILGTDGNEIVLRAEGSRFVYTINENLIWEQYYSPTSLSRYKVALTPTKAVITPAVIDS